jgi:hypothetical protein
VGGPTGTCKKKKEGLVEEMEKNTMDDFRLMLDQLQWIDHKVKTRKGWWRRWRRTQGMISAWCWTTPVDRPPGKNKEGLVEEMEKNIRDEFILMLDQLQRTELLLGRNGMLSWVVSIHKFRDTVPFCADERAGSPEGEENGWTCGLPSADTGHREHEPPVPGTEP